MVDFLAFVRECDDAFAAVVDFFGNACECRCVDAHGDSGNIPFVYVDFVDGLLGEVRHFAVHGTQRKRDGFGRTGDGLVRLLVNVFAGCFEELCLGEHGERIADLLGREGVLDLFCDFEREGAWHERGEFADDGIHGGFVVGERVGVDYAGVLFLGDAGEVRESRLFLFVVCRVPEFDHLLEVCEFKASEFHRGGHAREPDAAQGRFSFADELEVRRRSEPGVLRKFTPGKAGLLAFFVEVLHVAAVILVFGYRFHGVRLQVLGVRF